MAVFEMCVLAAALLFSSIPARAQQGSAPGDSMPGGSPAGNPAGGNPIIIGRSVQGRPISAHRIGSGPRSVVLVGGIHGGAEWNTIVLARNLRDRFQARPDRLPDGLTLFIIPNMNPDGLHAVTGGRPISEVDLSSRRLARGRFNAGGVDLNRNWATEDWSPTSYWGNTEVDAGAQPFSEPETRAVRDFILERNPETVIFYHGAADGIWYGGKPDQWAPARRLAQAYSNASGYPLPRAGEGPVDYAITGAASQYLYSRGIPTLTIELESPTETETDRNLRGLLAVLGML